MNIQDNENVFGKPILFENSIIFDLAGNVLPTSHPVVVFYDQDQDEYWYVAARSAIDNKGNKRIPFKEEIEIKSSKEGLFKKDSLIDTSKIYRIDRKLFHSLNIDNINIYHLTKEMTNNDIRTILNSICSNSYIGEISIAKVFMNENTGQLSQELQYCGKEVVDEVIERLSYKDEQISIKIGDSEVFGTKIDCFNKLKYYILEELNPKNNSIVHYFSETIDEFTYNFSSKTGVYDYVNGYEYTPNNRFNPFDESTLLDYKNYNQELEKEEESDQDQQKEKRLFKM